jgi:hypothetical protein
VEDRRTRLIDLFETALMTKAISCHNIEDYEPVMYAPGALFDKNTMIAETMGGFLVQVESTS